MSKTTTAHDDEDPWRDLPYEFDDDDEDYDWINIPPQGWDVDSPFDSWPSGRPHWSWTTTRNGICIGFFRMSLTAVLRDDPANPDLINYNAVVTQTTVTSCLPKGQLKCKQGQSLVHTMNGDPRGALGKKGNSGGGGLNVFLIANGGPFGPGGRYLPWPGLLGPEPDYGGWPSGQPNPTPNTFQGAFNYVFFLGCCKDDGCPSRSKSASFTVAGSISKSTLGPVGGDAIFPPASGMERAADIIYVQLLQQFGPNGSASKPKFHRCCR